MCASSTSPDSSLCTHQEKSKSAPFLPPVTLRAYLQPRMTCLYSCIVPTVGLSLTMPPQLRTLMYVLVVYWSRCLSSPAHNSFLLFLVPPLFLSSTTPSSIHSTSSTPSTSNPFLFLLPFSPLFLFPPFPSLHRLLPSRNSHLDSTPFLSPLHFTVSYPMLPYIALQMNMNPPTIGPESCYSYKDAIFFSGHKFIGGPGNFLS